MLRKAKDGLDWIGRLQTIQTIYQNSWVAIPLGWFAGTGWVGYMTNAPWMWIMAAMAMSGAFICMALFFSGMLYVLKDPEHKLKFVGANVGIDFVPSKGSAQNRKIAKMNVFMMIRNDAQFPISAYLAHAESSIEGKRPPRTKYPRPATSIGFGAVVLMGDDAVDMDAFDYRNFTADAFFVIKYGRKGKEKYELRVNGTLNAPMDR